MTEVRYTSSRIVLGRVANMFNNTSWRSNGIIYLGKGVQKLGYNYSTSVDYNKEYDLYQISNHKTEIPCDIEEILEIHHNGCRLPINKDVSMIGLDSDDYLWHGQSEYYVINYPYIKTSFESGEIKIFSKKFMFDKEGFLMIPDQIDYQEALQWHMVYNLLLDGETPKNKQIGLDYAESKYDQAKVNAQRDMNIMSKDEMRAFELQWNSLNVNYNYPKLQV